MVKSKGTVPAGYQSVMPYLRVRDAAAAIKFYKKVFGAKEAFRLRMAGKVGHAELTIGDAVIMISDEFPKEKVVGPKSLKGTSVSLAIYVEDVDAVIARAVKAGARIRRKPEDQFYGDRSGQIEDPFGHVWSVQTHVEDIEPKEMQRRLNAMMRNAKKAARSGPAKKRAATKSGAAKRGGAPKRVAATRTASKRASAKQAAPKRAAIKRTAAKGAASKSAAAPAKKRRAAVASKAAASTRAPRKTTRARS